MVEADGVIEGTTEPVLVHRWSHEASIAAKAQFGDLRYNNANRVIVGDFVRKWLRDEYPDIRNVDLVRFVPMAIELALLPSVSSVCAQEFSTDKTVCKRRALVNLPK